MFHKHILFFTSEHLVKPFLVDVASSVGLIPQRGLASSADKEDPSVTLWIYGDTKGDRDNTKKEIQTFIKSQSTRAEIKDQLLPTLKPNEVRKHAVHA